jgi:hypothetical protein
MMACRSAKAWPLTCDRIHYLFRGANKPISEELVLNATTTSARSSMRSQPQLGKCKQFR